MRRFEAKSAEAATETRMLADLDSKSLSTRVLMASSSELP
jgi:hypothetical protein